MPRYYFRVTDGKEVLNPHEGIELTGNAAARDEGVRLAHSIKEGKVLPNRKWDEWFLVITDAHGHEIERIPIDSVPDGPDIAVP